MDYIRTNKLKAALGSTGKYPSEIRYGSSKIYRMYHGNNIVWDVLRTTFSASNFNIGASGGDVASKSSVTSYGVNALGTREPLNWKCSPTTIAANSSTSSKTHTITYTQNDTGDTTTAVCTQAGQSIVVTGYRYSASVSNESIGDAFASGSTLSLSVSGTINVYEKYSDGSEKFYNSYSFGSTAATITSGDDKDDLAYLSSGKVVVKSAGTKTYSGYRIVYYIYGYSFSVDGESYSNNCNITVYQKENKVTGTEWGTNSSNYSLVASSDVAKFTSSGGNATISVTCQQQYRYTYTSGSNGDWTWGNGTATLKTSRGTLNTSSITGKGSAILTVGADEGKGETTTVTISTGGNVSTTISIPQTVRVVSSISYSEPSVVGTYQDANIPAWGGYAYLMVNWSQTQYTNYDNGTYTSSPVSGKSQAVILSGTVQQTGASLQSDGGIYKNSCGTTVTPQRTVYTVSAYYFEANGAGKEVRPVTIHLGQAPNSVTETKWLGTYNMSISYSPTGNLSNAGGTKTISVNCTENGTITYTSTATKDTTRNATATLTTTLGDLGTKSITGSGTSTLTIYSNYDEKTKTATVTAKCGSTSKSVSITQAAAVYDFHFVDPGTIDAYGGTYDITLISKVNSSFMTVIPESVKLSGGTVNKITENTSESKYNVNVTFPANSSTTNTKSYSIEAQQQNTGKTTSLTIIQAKKTSSYVTGSVSISSLVSGLYISSDGMLGGFNQYPTFTITAASNGWVNDCKYIFCLDFEIQLSNGQTFNPRYEHQLDYIEFSAFSGTETVQFINFPTSFNLQDLTDYQFDPYYSSVASIRIIADIQPVTPENMGSLMLSKRYEWVVN